MKTTLLIMAAGIGSRFGTGIKQLEPVDYAFQDINDIPGTLPEGRTKPWGTGQAVLAAKKVIKTPFIVINADDYYGKIYRLKQSIMVIRLFNRKQKRFILLVIK